MRRKETIQLDNFTASGEQFVDCNLIYAGGQPPTLTNCNFDNCTFTFAEGAGRTLALLAALYHGGFKGLIEDTFKNVRESKTAEQVRLH